MSVRSPARASAPVRFGRWIFPSLLIALAELPAQTLVWTGSGSYVAEVGAGNTTIGSGTTLNITTSSDHIFSATALINNGTTNWSGGGALRGWSGASFTNNGQFNDQNTAAVSAYSTFNNNIFFANASAGTYTKSGAATTTFGVEFNNAGSVVIQDGVFSLSAGGTNSGSFDTAAGATTRFDADYILSAGSALTGFGSYLLNAGTLTASGNLTVTKLDLSSGALAGTQIFGNSTLNWTGTNLGTSGTTTIAATSVLNLTTTADHRLSDSGARTLLNYGTANWTGNGAIRGWSGARLTNYAQFNDQNSGAASVYSTFNTDFIFANAATGTYTKSGAGTTSYAVAFDNAGTVTVQAGTLVLGAGGTNTGTFTTSATATTRFDYDYTLATGSSLTGAGAYLLAGGTLAANGSLTVTTFNLAAGTLAGTQTFANSTLNWTAANFGTGGTTTIATGSSLNLTTTSDHRLADSGARTLLNYGTTNWSGNGAIRGWSGARLTNYAQFNDQNSGAASVYSTFNTDFIFANAATGTYTKSGAGTTSYAVAFDNAGTVAVQAGTLALSGGGTNSGSFTTSATATTRFDYDYTLATGSSLTGAGFYQLAGGTFTANGNLTVTTFNLPAGTLTGIQTFANSTLNWTATNLGTDGTTTIAATSVLNLTTTSDHRLADSGVRSLLNYGTANWTGNGAIRGWSGARLTNYAQFNDQNSGAASVYYTFNTDFVFSNAAAGTYTKSGAGTTSFAVAFDNAGTVNVQAGTLALSGGGTQTGTFTTASGAVTQFDNDYALANGSALTGPGSYILNYGTLSANGSLLASNFNWIAGVLTGTQTFSSSVIDWSGTNLGTGGTTTIATGSSLNLTTTSDHRLADSGARTLLNYGTTSWSGNGAIRGWSGARLTNYGQFNDQNSGATSVYSTFNSDFIFTNATGGTYTKSGAGTTTFDIAFTNAGTLNVQGGSLVLNAGLTNTNGTLLVANGASLSSTGTIALGIGTLGGTGTITAPSVTAGGIVSPGASPGTLTITGDLSLLSTATTKFEIGGLTAGTQFDRINVSGIAALNGTLDLKFVNGFASSILSTDTFVLISAASLTGAFSNLTASGLRLNTSDGLGSFQVNYSGLAVSLSNFVPVPEPSTYALLALGAGLIAAFARRRR